MQIKKCAFFLLLMTIVNVFSMSSDEPFRRKEPKSLNRRPCGCCLQCLLSSADKEFCRKEEIKQREIKRKRDEQYEWDQIKKDSKFCCVLCVGCCLSCFLSGVDRESIAKFSCGLGDPIEIFSPWSIGKGYGSHEERVKHCMSKK